ncbi:MAG: SIMPL domain-containing protein [Muribaculaceae bacterium]|nr:SIMPL domain-containing protein [Muribaculaceae bacterium]
MKKSLLMAGGVALVFCLIVWAFGAFHHDNTPRTIAVSGECLTTAPKDRTAITLRVTTLDKSAATSMKQATTQIAAITEYLKTQDVQMQTTEFNSYEKTEWNRTLQKSETLGIETTIAVEVSSDNMEKIEQILSRFAGVQNVFTENLRMYTSSQAMKPILEDCLSSAVKNAQERANALAAGTGNRAGKMLAVSYGASNNAPQPYPTNFLRTSAKMAMTEGAMDSVAGSIVSKDTEVSVTVSAVFEIK